MAEASSSLSPPLLSGRSGHKPSLTALLQRDDIDAAVASLTSSSSDLIGTSPAPTPEGEPSDGAISPTRDVELPSAPPLSHRSFEGETFDPSEFLMGRRHTPLDELRSELRAYLATLRTSLVAVINTEYESFIGLSLGLRHANVAASLSTIRRPVLDIRAEVSRVKDSLERMRAEMDTTLSERKDVREKKMALRRLLEMEDQVDKVEALLKLAQGAASSNIDEGSGDSPAKRIERVAGEYTHVTYLVAKAGNLPFVRSLDPRIARIASTLQLDLGQLLRSTLTAPQLDRAELTTLLRTYASLELIPEAEDIIRTSLIRPFAERVIHRDALGGTSSQAPSPAPAANGTPVVAEPRSAFYTIEPIASNEVEGAVELVGLYNELLEFVSRDCGVLLDVAERQLAPASLAVTRTGSGEVDGKRKTFEVLSRVIFDELVSRLTSELGSVIFAAGRPAVFHANYVLANGFISRIESLCPTFGHLNALRGHPTYSAFTKRFQLAVYFQLRLKELVTSVERAFDAGSASGGGDVFVMSESEAVWRAIQSCWAPGVHLHELTARFWRLTLQLISRYRTWLNSCVPKYVMPSSASSANLQALGSNQGSARTSFEGGRASLGPSRPGTPAGAQEDITEEQTLKQLTVLIADAKLMEIKLRDLFEHNIKALLPTEEEDAVDSSAAAVLDEALRLLTSLVPSLSGQVITILVKHCAEHLKSVRAAISQVRASTRKTAGAEPSFFVPLILRELAGYLSGPGRVVDERLRLEWATAVVEEVANKYTGYLNEQKKTQASLSWLKKGRQGGLSFFGRGAAAQPEEGAQTDDDRVKAQIQLDVDTLAADAERLGVRVEGMRAFEALRNAIVDTSDDKK